MEIEILIDEKLEYKFNVKNSGLLEGIRLPICYNKKSNFYEKIVLRCTLTEEFLNLRNALFCKFIKLESAKELLKEIEFSNIKKLIIKDFGYISCEPCDGYCFRIKIVIYVVRAK